MAGEKRLAEPPLRGGEGKQVEFARFSGSQAVVPRTSG